MKKITNIEDFLYLQIFSKLIFESNLYHLNNKKVFENTISNSNIALELDERNYPNNFDHQLPIFKDFSIEKTQDLQKKTIKTLLQRLKVSLSPKTTSSEEFLSEAYLNASYFKHYSKSAVNFLDILNSHKLKEPVLHHLNTLYDIINQTHNNYSIYNFWASTEHKSFLNRLKIKTKAAIKTPSIAHLDLIFSIATSFYNYTNQASIKFYEKTPISNTEFKQSYRNWIQFLTDFNQISTLIAELLSITLIHKLHYISTLLNSKNNLKETNKTNYDMLLNFQRNSLSQLCEHSGLIHTIFETLNKLSIQMSKYDIGSTALTEKMKLSHFEIKNNVNESNYALKSTLNNHFFQYLNNCFSTNLKSLGYNYIELFYSFLPYQNIIPEIKKEITYNLSKITGILNKSNINTKTNISILDHDLKELNSQIKKIETTLQWVSILGLYLSEKSQYGFFCELLLEFTQSKELKKFSSYLAMYYSALLNKKAFTHISSYICHASSLELLKLFSFNLKLYSTKNESIIVNNSLIIWSNSNFFLNRWKIQFRNQIFNLPKEIWHKLYNHFTVDFIEFSPLIKEWAKFCTKNTQEQYRLNHLIHTLSNKLDAHDKLYSLFILLKQYKFTNPNFENIKLNHEFFEEKMSYYFSQIRFIYNTDLTYKLNTVEEYIDLIIQESTSIHLSYSSAISSDLVISYASSFIFILKLSLKYELKNSEKLLNFIALIYKSNPLAKKELNKQLTFLQNNFNLSKTVINQLKSLSKQTHEHSRNFILLLLTMTDLSTTRSTKYNKNSTLPFSAKYNIKSIINKMEILNYNALLSHLNEKNKATNLSKLTSLEKINSFLIANENNILVFFNSYIANLCQKLRKVTLENNFNSFLETKTKLEHFLNHEKNECIIIKSLLANYISACTLLLKNNENENLLTLHNLYTIDFTKFKKPDSFIFFSTIYLNQFDIYLDHTITPIEISQISQLLSAFSELSNIPVESNLTFIHNYLKLLNNLNQSTQIKSEKLKERLVTLLDKTFQYCLTTLISPEKTNKTLKSLLPIVNDHLYSGFFHSDHQFLKSISEFIIRKEFLSESEIRFQEIYSDLSELDLMFNKPEKTNSYKLAALLKKSYIIPSFIMMSKNNSGQLLTLIYQLISNLKSETPTPFNSYIPILNASLNIASSETQWKNCHFIYDILNIFFIKSTKSQSSTISINLEMQTHEKNILDSLFDLMSLQSSNVLTEYVEITKSSHPMTKDQILNLVEELFQERLSNKRKSIQSVHNSSISDLIKTKLNLDQKTTKTLSQMEELIINISTTLPTTKSLVNFITQLYINFENIKVIPTKKSLEIHEHNQINHLLNCINTFNEIDTVLDPVNTSIINNCIFYLTKLFINIYFNIFTTPKISRNEFNNFIIKNNEVFNQNLSTYFSNNNFIVLSHIKKLGVLSKFIETQSNNTYLFNWILNSKLLHKLDIAEISTYLFELSNILNANEINSLIKHINNSYIAIGKSNTALFMYLLNHLNNQDYNHFETIIKTSNFKSLPNYKALKYLTHPIKKDHFLNTFFETITKKTLNINTFNETIYFYIKNHNEDINFLLELTYLFNKPLFYEFFEFNYPENIELLLETLIHNKFDKAMLNYVVTKNILELSFTNDPIKQLASTHFENHINYEIHPALFTQLIKTNYKSNPKLINQNLHNWIIYSLKYEPLETSFKILRDQNDYGAALLFKIFFQESSSYLLSPNYFLSYLVFLRKNEFIQLIQLLKENHSINIYDFCTNLFNWINQSNNPNTYNNIFLHCETFLTTKHFLENSINLSSENLQIISMAILKHSTSTKSDTLFLILKKLDFLPLEISSHCLNLMSDMFDSVDHHTDLLDLSIQNETIFKQLIQKKEIATKIQSLIFYNKMSNQSPLLNKIIDNLHSITFFETIHFLINYSSKKLSKKKIEDVTLFLYEYIPQFPNSTFQNITEVKQSFLNIVNTPIFSISTDDIILNSLFSYLEKSITNTTKNEYFLYYLISTQKINSANNFSFITMKSQLKASCLKKETKMHLIHCLHQPKHLFNLKVFHTLIKFWQINQSFYNVIQLHLSLPDEVQEFQNYLVLISTSIPKYYIYASNDFQKKQIFDITHFFIANNINATFLINWITEKIQSSKDKTLIKYLNQFLQCSLIEDTKKFSIIKALLLKYENEFPIEVFSSLNKDKLFFKLWDYYLKTNKKYILLSDINNINSELFKFLKSFINSSLKYNSSNILTLCSTHHANEIPLDGLFKEIYDTAFNYTSTSETKNNLIKLTKKAITLNHKDYLYYFAKSSKDFKFQHHFNWIIELFHNCYRLQKKSYSNFHSSYTKSLLQSNILNDNYEFVTDFTSLTWNEFISIQDSPKEILNLKSYYLWLRHKFSSQFKNTHNSLEILFNLNPDFVIPDSPSELRKYFSNHAISTVTYIDSLISVAIKSNTIYLSFIEALTIIKKNKVLTVRFFNYLNQIDFDYIYPLLIHDKLSSDLRYFLLRAYLNVGLNKTQSRHLTSIINEIKSFWMTPSGKPTIAQLEILLVLQLHFPNNFKKDFNSILENVLESTGINFPKIFSCKITIERLIQQNTNKHLTEIIDSFVPQLNSYGFNSFDIIHAFRLSSFYSQELENHILSEILTRRISYNKNTFSNALINLHYSLHLNSNLIYVDDNIFKENSISKTFKNWLKKEGHLDEENILSISSLNEFESIYDCEDIFNKLINEINKIENNTHIKSEKKKENAILFFKKFFSNIQPKFNIYTKSLNETYLLLNTTNCNLNYFEISQLKKDITLFSNYIKNNNFSKLLNSKYIPLIMNLICNNSQTKIDHSKLTKVVNRNKIKLNINHDIFSSLNLKEKNNLTTLFLNKRVLNKNDLTINEKIFLKEKSLISQNHTLFNTYSFFEKYIVIQKEIASSFFTMLANIGLFTSLNHSYKKSIFENYFCNLQDHEWVYFNHMLKQKIFNISLHDEILNFLRDFNIHNTNITKQSLKTYKQDIKIKKINLPDTTSSLIEDIYSVHNSNYHTKITETKLIIDLLNHLNEDIDKIYSYHRQNQ